MSNLHEYAEAELKLAGLLDEDSDYGGMLGRGALEIIDVFRRQGHSGHSAHMMAEILNKLLRYEPLMPLTYAEDEWMEVDTGMWQNRRKSDVFSKDHGATWYCLDGTEGVRS
jgi:hypothetical protein